MGPAGGRALRQYQCVVPLLADREYRLGCYHARPAYPARDPVAVNHAVEDWFVDHIFVGECVSRAILTLCCGTGLTEEGASSPA